MHCSPGRWHADWLTQHPLLPPARSAADADSWGKSIPRGPGRRILPPRLGASQAGAMWRDLRRQKRALGVAGKHRRTPALASREAETLDLSGAAVGTSTSPCLVPRAWQQRRRGFFWKNLHVVGVSGYSVPGCVRSRLGSLPLRDSKGLIPCNDPLLLKLARVDSLLCATICCRHASFIWGQGKDRGVM